MSSPQQEVQRLTVNEASDNVLNKTVNHRLRTVRGCTLSYSTHTRDYHLWNEGDDLCASRSSSDFFLVKLLTFFTTYPCCSESSSWEAQQHIHKLKGQRS